MWESIIPGLSQKTEVIVSVEEASPANKKSRREAAFFVEIRDENEFWVRKESDKRKGNGANYL